MPKFLPDDGVDSMNVSLPTMSSLGGIKKAAYVATRISGAGSEDHTGYNVSDLLTTQGDLHLYRLATYVY